jgi:ornithine carbamoyltransferase
VWNGLTNKYHPTQVLADLMTIQENIKKPLEKVVFTYIGDGRNNMANSLLIAIACSIMGMETRIISFKSLLPAKELIKKQRNLPKARVQNYNN